MRISIDSSLGGWPSALFVAAWASRGWDEFLWDRRGTVLEPAGQGPDGSSVHTPCVVRPRDGSVGMWYAGIPIGDEELGYRICSARFPGPWST